MCKTTETQDLKSKVQDIVDKFKDDLANKGISIQVTKKYRETDIKEKTRGDYQFGIEHLIVDGIATELAKKDEKRKGYKNVPNRYHYIVLTISPIDRTLLHKNECKCYSFFLKKIERLHIGLEPEKKLYQEEKLLKKIEKRIKKIVSKSKKLAPKKVCKDTLFDAFRYTISKKYVFKEKVLGKEREFYHWLTFIPAIILCVIIVFVLWLVSKI